jgi:FAD/FMN-containing dehydrogenase
MLQTGLAVQPALVTDAGVLEAYRHDASPIVGNPEALLRPTSAAEAAAALAAARGQGIAVTPCGLRSSTTGSGLAPHGWAMSCERLVGVSEIDVEGRRAIVGAGTVLREFKDEVEAAGLFYPPDPTSEKECSLGGTVACDASGARTYLYGPTHRWLLGVEVAMTDGSVRWFRRRPVDKDASGFAAMRDLVSLLCGSEGTLGFITNVEVKLLPKPPAFTAGLAFFDDLTAALAFVGRARQDRTIAPRCLELLDETCLTIMRAQDSGVTLPATAGACVFFEQEHAEGADMAVLEAWWALLEAAPGALADDTVIASDRRQQEELRTLRHAIPATLNEEGASFAAQGGKKVSTDWAVPFEHLPGLMEQSDRWLAEEGLERIARYGHVGNGHPHYNVVVRDAEEAACAARAVDKMCRRACELGGTVSAEHGMGKVKLAYAHHRFSALELAAMRAVKGVFDPEGILAPGNLFPDG